MMNMPTPQGGPQQAPGQAAMPGQAGGITSVMPQPGQGGPRAGVQAFMPSVERMQPLELMAALANPNMGIPAWAIVSELNDRAVQAKRNAANARQQAMMAGGSQGRGTVTDQVVQQALPVLQQGTRMARHGGTMRSYAGGGIVAFSNGGDALEKKLIAQGVPSAFIAQKKKEGLSLADIEVEARREGYLPPMLAQTFAVAPQPVTSVISSPEEQVVPEEAPLARRQMTAEAVRREVPGATLARGVKTLVTGEKPDFYKQQFQDPDVLTRELAGETRQLPQTPLPPEFALPPSQRMMDTRAIPAPRATGEGATTTRPAPSTGATGLAALVEKDIPEVKTAYDKIAAAAGLTPEQQKMLEEKQAVEMGLRREAEAGRKQRAEESFARSAKSYADVLAGQEGLLGQRGLLELAASIDPRRGYLFGSLAKGAAGILGREQEEKRKAQTAYEVAQQKFSDELNALDGIKLATAERDTAILNNNMNAAREAEVKRQQLVIDYNRLKRERAVAEQKAAIEAHEAESKRITAQSAGAQAAATREATAATREATNLTRLQGQLGVNINNLQQELEKSRKAHVAENGPIYLLTKVPGAKLTPEQQASLDKAESDWAAKEKAIERKYMPLINETSKKLYGVPYSQVSGESQGNVMTRADVEATARSSGKTVEEVEAAARAKGFTIKD